MTAPTPDAGGSSPGSSKKPATKPVDLLDVVEFPHHDPLTRRTRRSVGVVVEVNDQSVTVVPLTHHHIQVAASDVTKVTADDNV